MYTINKDAQLICSPLHQWTVCTRYILLQCWQKNPTHMHWVCTGLQCFQEIATVWHAPLQVLYITKLPASDQNGSITDILEYCDKVLTDVFLLGLTTRVSRCWDLSALQTHVWLLVIPAPVHAAVLKTVGALGPDKFVHVLVSDSTILHCPVWDCGYRRNIIHNSLCLHSIRPCRVGVPFAFVVHRLGHN